MNLSLRAYEAGNTGLHAMPAVCVKLRQVHVGLDQFEQGGKQTLIIAAAQRMASSDSKPLAASNRPACEHTKRAW